MADEQKVTMPTTSITCPTGELHDIVGLLAHRARNLTECNINWTRSGDTALVVVSTPRGQLIEDDAMTPTKEAALSASQSVASAATRLEQAEARLAALQTVIDELRSQFETPVEPVAS